jgi:histidine phosphotransfer protein HptB
MPEPVPSPLHSQFRTDPDMAELVGLFVSEIPSRIDAIREAWAGRQLHTLKHLVHQVRGSSAGFGFPAIGTAAGALEDALRARGTEEADLEQIAKHLDELVALCARAAT